MKRPLIIALLAFVPLFLAVPASASGLIKAGNNLGLKAYYSFEDGAGLQATDFSGGGNTGTLTNGPVWTGGKFGKGLLMDGNDDFVDLTSTTGLNLTDITVSAWVKLSSVDEAIIVEKNGAWQLMISNSQKAYWSVAGTGQNYEFSDVLSPNVWYHILGTYVSGGGANSEKLYLNGALVDSHAGSTAIPSNSNAVSIGYYTLYSVNGLVDEVRIYNRALGPTEVAALYASGVAKVNASMNTRGPQSGLIGQWSFDGQDVSGTTAYDRSGQGNNGTLTGTAAIGAGKLGQALSFPGGNGNYVSITPTSTLKNIGQAGDSYSVTLWFKPKPLSGEYNLVQKEAVGSGIQSIRIVIESDGNISARLYDGTNFPLHAVSYGNNNEWHFLYVEYIRGSTIGISVDGAAVTTAADTTSGSLTSSNENLGIGAKAAFEGGTNGFNGSIDDVRIYNRTLSATEIRQLYNLGSTTVNKSNVGGPGTSGLVLWHTFDGPKLNSTTSTDSSGNGNNGTLSGGPVPTFGKIGQALFFDGVNDLVSFTQTSGLPIYSKTSPYSISMWVKPQTGGDAVQELYGETSPGTSFFRLKFISGNIYSQAVDNSSNSAGANTTDSPITYNQWNHVVYTDSAGAAKVYVNGVQNSADMTYTPPAGAFTLNASRVGSFIGSIDWFKGTLDDVRVYSRALSASEVLQLYNAGK